MEIVTDFGANEEIKALRVTEFADKLGLKEGRGVFAIGATSVDCY